MAESLGLSFRLVETGACWIAPPTVQDAHADQQSSQNGAKDDVLGLDPDVLIIVLYVLCTYWSPSTKFRVLALVFMTVPCDTDMVRDVDVSDRRLL
jgi:hypothetical protein